MNAPVFAGVVVAALACGTIQAAAQEQSEAAVATATFVSPPESAIPDDEFGKVVKLGEAIFRDPVGPCRRLCRQRAHLLELPSRRRPSRQFRADGRRLRRIPRLPRQERACEHVRRAAAGLLSLQHERQGAAAR